jgi:preprotein translocase subunit SecG
MGKLTSGVAIVFMLTSLLLAYFYASPGSSTIMPQTVEQASPASPASPPAENAQPAGEAR